MNKTQLTTSTAALIGVAAGYAAGQHWLGLGVDAWTSVIGGLVAVGAIVAPAILTRLQSLKDTVGRSGAKVLTDAASANALPDNPNVIATTPAIAAAVSKGA